MCIRSILIFDSYQSCLGGLKCLRALFLTSDLSGKSKDDRVTEHDPEHADDSNTIDGPNACVSLLCVHELAQVTVECKTQEESGCQTWIKKNEDLRKLCMWGQQEHIQACRQFHKELGLVLSRVMMSNSS